MSDALSGVLFEFEDLGDSLKLLPLAARRALDVGGFRLSLEGWQSLSEKDRTSLTLEGARDVVDAHAVEQIVRRASIPPTRIRPVPDPDPLSPPEQLNGALASMANGERRTIEPAQWSRLRALDRYALIHVLRRSIAHDDPQRLETAVAIVLEKKSDAPKRVVPVDRGDGVDLRRTLKSRTPEADNAHRDSPFDRNPSERPPPRVLELESERSVRSRAGRPRGEGDAPNGLPPSGVVVTDPPPLPPLEPVTARPGSVPAPRRDEETGPRRAPRFEEPVPDSEAALTHLDRRGQVHMVDVGEKNATVRRATASGSVRMRRETAARLARNDVPKGEVLAAARIAGIMAAKRTPDLVPLCHSIALTHVEVHVEVDAQAGLCRVKAVAEATDRTGVEMEALVAVSVACLTIYDMLKAVDRDMVITDVQLLEKTGGKAPYTRDV